MNVQRNYATFVVAAVLAATAGGSAALADAPAGQLGAFDTAKPEGDVAANTQDIIVTARRRSETLYKTPVAITPLRGSDLVEQGVTTASQLGFAAPSVTVAQGPNGVQISIRGVTTSNTTVKAEADVSFSTDGVPVERTQEQGLGFFDVQRLEVLSGPQSTLYGISSTAGAINVITNAPASKSEASGMVEYGNYDTRRFQAMVNQPITDNLAVRIAVSGNYREGDVNIIGAAPGGSKDQVPNDENNLSRRVSLQWKPGDFTVRLTETGGSIGGVGAENNYPLTVANVHGYTITDGNFPASGVFRLNATAGSGVYANMFQGFLDDHYENPVLKIDGPIGPVHVALVSSYDHFSQRGLYPDAGYSSTQFEGVNDDRLYQTELYDTTFQDLRFSNENGHDRWQYIFGINYLSEVIHEDTHGLFYNTSALVPDDANQYDATGRTTHKNFSIYLHNVFAITSQLHATLGGREEWDSVATQGSTAGGPENFSTNPPSYWLNANGTPCLGLDTCVGGSPNGYHGKDHGLALEAGLDYAIDDANLVYVTFARGYKPGGVNDAAGTVPSLPYGPERLNAYEGGYKFHLPSGWSFTAAGFFYDFKAQQLTGLEIVDEGGGSTTATVETGLYPTKEYGAELAAVIPLTHNDKLDLGANFLHGHYAAGNGALSGLPLSNMPTAVLTANYRHEFDLDNGAKVNFRAGTRYSTMYLEVVNPNSGTQVFEYRQAPFTRSMASIGYTTASGKFTVEAFINNIENKRAITAAGTVPGEPQTVANGSATDPRFFGGRVLVNF
jgi:iron complex outermembrane recepter protein